MTERKSIGERAGTKLDPKFTRQIAGSGKRGMVVHGVFDARQRVYQSGGEADKFIHHQKQAITMAADAFRMLQALNVETVEMIDHDTNRCYRVPFEDAAKFGYFYSSPIGERFAVALHHWTIVEPGE